MGCVGVCVRNCVCVCVCVRVCVCRIDIRVVGPSFGMGHVLVPTRTPGATVFE